MRQLAWRASILWPLLRSQNLLVACLPVGLPVGLQIVTLASGRDLYHSLMDFYQTRLGCQSMHSVSVLQILSGCQSASSLSVAQIFLSCQSVNSLLVLQILLGHQSTNPPASLLLSSRPSTVLRHPARTSSWRSCSAWCRRSSRSSKRTPLPAAMRTLTTPTAAR